MNKISYYIQKCKKWTYTHQMETLIIIVSILATVIGSIAISPFTILIIGVLDFLIFFGEPIYNKIVKKEKNVVKEEKEVEVKKEEGSDDMATTKKKSNSKTVNRAELLRSSSSYNSNRKKKQKKKKRLLWLKLFLAFIFVCIIAVLIAMIAFFMYIAKNAPTFNPDELYSSESTIVYAKDGTKIATLGSEKREKVSYLDLPEVFVDALVATEDSRYFQHNGFDFPRFMKASLGHVLGHSNAGGASTLTMQISKNAFTSTEDEGIQGIIRKFTDIYLAIFQIEKNYSKEQIIEFYVNNNLLGGHNYGVEQAALTYFGKHAKDMNLSESALLAGMFQSPNAYNPLTKPENAAYRRGIVLRLMVRHGYITQAEADIAGAIPIEDLTKNSIKSTDDTDYQGFIDTLVSEIKKDTGYNPYTTAMEIYSTMDIKKQKVVNDVMSGKTYKWENKHVQAGIVVLDTKTGAIVAVGTNRDDSASGLLNHATFENQTRRQIGSTAKPLYDYGPAVEYNDASPAQLVGDEPYTYSDGKQITNYDGGFKGLLTYRAALADSRNIPALKAFQSVDKANIIEFVTNLGLSPEKSGNVIHEAHAIGGYNGESPMTIASAYAAFGNKGKYTEGYSYTKIIYRDTNESYSKEKNTNQAMSEATAYIISDMLVTMEEQNRYINANGWKFAAKTGTTNFSSETKKANGLADNAINDLWLSGFTDEYTITVWYGYDKIYKNAYTHYGNLQHTKIFNTLAKKIFSGDIKLKMPDSVKKVTVEAGTVELMLPSEYTPKSQMVTELFKEGSEPTEVSTRFARLSNVSNLQASSSNGEITLSWNGVSVDWLNKTYLNKYFSKVFKGSGSRSSAVNSRVKWNNSNLGSLGYDIYQINSDGSSTKIGSTTNTSYTFEPTTTSGTYLVKTAYTKFKSNQSSGVSIHATVNGTITNYSITVSNQTINEGSSFDYINNVKLSSNACTFYNVLLNGSDSYSSWANTNAAIMKLTPGQYRLTVSYKCGASNRIVTGSGTITVQ